MEQRVGEARTRTIALYGPPKVGRTGVAVNLALLLARAGFPATLVHADEGWPGASPLGAPPAEGVAEVRPGLRLVLVSPTEAPDTLRMRCRALGEEGAGFLVLDVPTQPPGFRHALLSVAGEVVLLACPSRTSLQALAEDLQLVTGVMGTENPDLQVVGLLTTLADRNLLDYERLLVRIERIFPVEVFPFCVPRDEHASPEGSAVEVAPMGRYARACVELAREVLHHVR